MPSSYPLERAALVACPKSKGLSHTHVDELLAAARKAADEGIGMASIFMVAEAVKEWLQANNLAGLDGSMYSGIVSTVFTH